VTFTGSQQPVVRAGPANVDGRRDQSASSEIKRDQDGITSPNSWSLEESGRCRGTVAFSGYGEGRMVIGMSPSGRAAGMRQKGQWVERSVVMVIVRRTGVDLGGQG
jgi:hypothetical protein